MTRGRRSRRPAGRGSGLRRAGTGVLVLATLVAGAWLDRFTPVGPDGLPAQATRWQRPFAHPGRPGAPVTAPRLAVTVHGVTGAGTLRRGRSGGAAPLAVTAGVWLLVDVTVTARQEPLLVGFIALRDPAGRSYDATARVPQQLGDGREFQPGIPARGTLVFEVPAAVAAGPVTLVLGEHELEHRLEEQVEVALPGAGDRVTAWRAASVPVPGPGG